MLSFIADNARLVFVVIVGAGLIIFVNALLSGM